MTFPTDSCPRKPRVALVLVLALATLPAAASSAPSLPDAPQPVAVAAGVGLGSHIQTDTSATESVDTRRTAARLAKYIESNEEAVPLSAREKLELSGWEQLQPWAFGTQIIAAGWEHLLNSDPKYGTDKAGFGERLGAATLRQGTQAILADGVFAAAFKEDPRYYVLGSGSILHRAVYAATRVVIIRKDDGAESVNYAQLVGYAGASALTMTYYPAVSATWPKTAQGYAISLVGAALGNGVHEFLPEVVRAVFHRHRKPKAGS